MAAMLLAMLFIGVSMVASLGDYHRLVAIHRPLGIMILILAAIRLVNRMFTKLPPFPPTMSRRNDSGLGIREVALRPDVRPAARGLGHVVSGPLSDRDVRASASAADSSGQSDALRGLAQSRTRSSRICCSLTFLAHLSAVLFHTLIVRDRLLDRMALWPIRSGKNKSQR